MRFPAVYQAQVESYLKGLLWNLPPVKGEELEIVFREIQPNAAERALAILAPFDLMEGLGDETPNLSGAEVAPIEE